MVENGNFDAIVIGSGIGGLSCAALLSVAGKRVLILEQANSPGGCMQAIPAPPGAEGDDGTGWSWNMGIQYLAPMSTMIGPVRFEEKLLWPLLTDPPVELVPLGEPKGEAERSTYQRLVLPDIAPDFEVELKSDHEAMKAQLIELFGETQRDRDNIEAFWEYIHLVDSNVVTLLMPKALPWPLSRVMFPWLTKPIKPLMDMTLQQALDKTFQGGTHDEDIKLVLSSYWNFLGLPPETNFLFWTIGINLQMHGVWTVAGGSEAMIEGFLGTVRKKGGEIRCGKAGDVRRILLEGCCGKKVVGVETADGAQVRSPLVVSSAGLPATVGAMLPADAFPGRVRRSMDRHYCVPSNVMLRIGFSKALTRERLAEVIGFKTTFRWMAKGSWDMDHDPTVPDWDPDEVMIIFPAFYETEPGDPGPQTCEVIYLADYQRFFSRFEGMQDPAYQEAMTNMKASLLRYFGDKFPTLAPYVQCTWLTNPLGIELRTRQEAGSIYGYDSYKLLDNAILPRSGVKGLYLSGEDILAHGVSIASGMNTVAAVLADEWGPLGVKWAMKTALRFPWLCVRALFPLGPTYRVPPELLAKKEKGP